MRNSAFLLTWNPKKWHWHDFEADYRKFQKNGRLSSRWNCANLNAKKGDEFFFLRQGPELRGIIGHGLFKGGRRSEEHFDEVKASNGRLASYIDIEFDSLSHRNDNPFIQFSDLEKIQGQSWSPQKSGIVINEPAASELRKLWKKCAPAVTPDEHFEAFENARSQKKTAEIYVRDKQIWFAARVRRFWGGKCALTKLSSDFCEACHIKPYSKSRPDEQVDPFNGIYLASHLHKAFDKNLIGIRPDGRVFVSKRMSFSDRKLLGSITSLHISFDERHGSYLQARFKEFQNCNK